MHLPAITLGDAVPGGDFDASVHSVFQSAINLRPSGGGVLLTLVTASEADLPQGIRVDSPRDFSFETFHVGEQGTCRDNCLRLNSLSIDLRGARRWKCDLPAVETDPTDPAVSSAWSRVWGRLNKRQSLVNAEIIANTLLGLDESARAGVAPKAGKAMYDLLDATRRYDLTDTSAISALIGLGPGLTPSGDDLLLGYMAGLWCAIREKKERIRFISDLGEVVIQHSRLTNDISRTYLHHAARGQVSSLLANLAEAISYGAKTDRLLDVAEAAMRVGHTSGMEAVTGLLMGLTAWDGDCLLSI